MPHAQLPVVPRTGLDFGFDGGVPRYWFGADPFKTRLFDAVSTIFPPGERFFMGAVRRYAKDVHEPELARAVEAFLVQEGQHSKLHSILNALVRAQGHDVDAMEAVTARPLEFLLRHAPRRVTIAQTAAAEHLTALLGEFLLTHPTFMADADARVRALYTWHAVEEVEHKAVAFDVMVQSGEVGSTLRRAELVIVTLIFQARLFQRLDQMLRKDGFGLRARLHIWREGLAWLGGDQGLYTALVRGWLRYFRADFHPWNEPAPDALGRWLAVYTRTGDPLRASEAARTAAEPGWDAADVPHVSA